MSNYADCVVLILNILLNIIEIINSWKINTVNDVVGKYKVGRQLLQCCQFKKCDLSIMSLLIIICNVLQFFRRLLKIFKKNPEYSILF